MDISRIISSIFFCFIIICFCLFTIFFLFFNDFFHFFYGIAQYQLGLIRFVLFNSFKKYYSGKCPFFSVIGFWDLPVSVKGRFGKCLSGKTLFVICPGINLQHYGYSLGLYTLYEMCFKSDRTKIKSAKIKKCEDQFKCKIYQKVPFVFPHNRQPCPNIYYSVKQVFLFRSYTMNHPFFLKVPTAAGRLFSLAKC